ncbi:LysR family transcriptional regulator [Thalassospira alkalitolerans]|uniref:LysR family transcriptional regulator n=1 Tax=Thalassospira alkalitolerans TaxID=1293890 RepID=UPI003AA8872A
MELRWLEDYLALAETLNFSRASELRHITQPAFSRRIRALEDWVGTPLFSRTTHAVALTPAGAHFRVHAEALARQSHQVRRDTREIGQSTKSGLTFAATHALSFTFFPGWVREFDDMLTMGTFNLVSDSLERCEEFMLRGDVQFLLCHCHHAMGSALEGDGFVSISIGQDVLIPMSAPGPDGRAKWPLSQGEDAPWLAYSTQSGLGRILATEGAPKHENLGPKAGFTSYLAATLLSMVKSGAGVAWLPKTLATPDLANGSLVPFGGPELHVPVDIRLFRPKSRQKPAVERFWAAVTKG